MGEEFSYTVYLIQALNSSGQWVDFSRDIATLEEALKRVERIKIAHKIAQEALNTNDIVKLFYPYSQGFRLIGRTISEEVLSE